MSESSIDGDGGTGLDGDSAPQPRRVRDRRGRDRERSVDISCGAHATLYIVASVDRRAIGRQRWHLIGHPRMSSHWTGSPALAVAVLFTWHFYNTCDTKELPDNSLAACEEAQRCVRGRVSGFVTFRAHSYALTPYWQTCSSIVLGTVQGIARDMEWAPRYNGDPPGETISLDALLQRWADESDASHLSAHVMIMHPAAILSMLEHSPEIFHAVALPDGRVPCRHRFPRGSPPPALLRVMVATVARPGSSGKQQSSKKRCRQELTAEENIEFLAASSSAKSLRCLPKAGKSWEAIFKRHFGEEITLPTLPCYDVLRKARIRFDMMMMLAFRFWLADLIASEEKWALYVYMDASPQWRGRELYAATIDVVRPDNAKKYSRHLLPIINLGVGYRSVLGKGWALLWMLALITGPKYENMRAVLKHIRSITTDLGAEFAVRDLPDCLIGFLRSLGSLTPAAASREEFLFPLCLAAPGWHHLFDGLLRFGLSMLDFPSFLQCLKALSKWIRNCNTELVTAFEGVPLHGAAALVRKANPPKFAQWRWKTLALVTKCLNCGILVVLRDNAQLVLPLLGGHRDKAFATSVRKCLFCEKFPFQFAFVHWFSRWMTRMEKFGSTCPCPEHAGLPNVVCPMRGRLLHVAHRYARESFDDAIHGLQEWQAERFGNDLLMMQQASACVRATVARGLEKIHFLDRLPYLLASLDQGAAVAERALSQFDEAGEERHHRITLRFLGRHSLLRQHVIDVSEGHDLSPELLDEVMWLQQIPLDDSVGESPHATARRCELHSRGARFGWHAAMQRLGHNLRDWGDMHADLPVSAQWLWDEYKRVPNMKSGGKRKSRCTFKQLEATVYHLRGSPSLLPGDVAGSDDFEDGDDPPDGKGKAPRRGKAEQDKHMFRLYLESALKVSDVFSVQRPGCSPAVDLYQLLEKSRRLITVKCFDHEEKAHMWNVQKFELWRAADDVLEPEHLEAFVLEDASRVDVLDLVGTEFQCRHQCRAWSPLLSDVDGCHAFNNPQRLRCQLPLSSDSVSVLALAEELEAQGYAGVARVVDHVPAAPKAYDKKCLGRPYLQAVLACDWLFANGCATFTSRNPQCFYKLLLRDPRVDLSSLSVPACLEMLRGMDAALPDIEVLDRIPPARPTDLADSHAQIDGDVLEPPPGSIAGAAAAEPRPDSDGDASAGVDGDAPAAWPTHVMGVALHTEARITNTGAFTEGFRIVCPRHGGCCKKYKAKHLRQEQDGRLAAIYFLGAWIKCADGRDAGEHQKYNPTVREIREFMLSDDCI